MNPIKPLADVMEALVFPFKAVAIAIFKQRQAGQTLNRAPLPYQGIDSQRARLSAL